MTEKTDFEKLVAIMRRLRSPGGCPWDAEQTHDSLKRYLLEETYEVMEAIDAKSPEHLREELGDLLLQPVFHAAIAEENGSFNINDIIQTLCEKLIRRHPHVFGDLEIKDSNEQIENWERIKKIEKGSSIKKSALSGIPPALPALLKAQKITEKAARTGFDWENAGQIVSKIKEELQELEEALSDGKKERIESELGDLLFSVVNLGRFLSINPEDALHATINRFQKRFHHIEDSLESGEISVHEASIEEMERLWDEAKKLEK